MGWSSWRGAAAVLALPVLALGVADAAGAVDYEMRDGTQRVERSGPAANLGGGRADLDIEFALELDGTSNTSGGAPAAATRTAVVDLPEGLVGNPTTLAICSMDYVLAQEDQTNRASMGKCPRESAIGWAVIDATYPNGGAVGVQRRRIWRVPARPNEAAAFATSILGLPIRMAATVTPSGGYRVSVTGDDLPQAGAVRRFQAHLWAVPADHQGDGGRPPTGYDGLGGPQDCDGSRNNTTGAYSCTLAGLFAETRFGSPLPGAERKPFLSNGSECRKVLDATIDLTPWGRSWSPLNELLAVPPLKRCADQPFAPSFATARSSRQAGRPTGYAVTIDVPQNDDPDGLATAHVKDVSVTLPRGMAISPPSANGLDACTDAQLDRKGDADPTCPDASKIGTLRIDTPLLEDPVMGSAYLGTQLSQDPASGEMYRLFLVAKAPGVLIKLKGAVKADPVTGQLTATFADNPQMPFSRMTLNLDGGERASLVNPTACGNYTASATITSWAGHSRTLTSTTPVDAGCPRGWFAPTLLAGTVNPLAGSYSPFNMTVARSDVDRDLSRLNLELPSGLLAALGSVPLCGEAAANAGTCSEASRIGSTSVLVGSGGEPLPLKGKVFVTGPYKGAPFGLSVVVPAKVGPFDLGTVVVRGQLRVDANRAKATAVTDPFPTIVGGVPVRLRQVSVSMDRPGFMFNATSCQPMKVVGGFWSTDGASNTAAVDYQAKGCDKLELNPRLGLQWFGKKQMKTGKHPGLKARLGDMAGQANLKQVKVTLPLTAALDPDNAKALCEPSDAAAGKCPDAAIVGKASATTPALHLPVSGPIYFVRGVRISATGREVATLPKLWIPLKGQGITVDLWADSDVDSKKRLVSTFKEIPDVPVRDFQLELYGGSNGILKATNDVCGASKTTTIAYTGHNGGVTERRVKFTAPDCTPQIMTATNSRNNTLPVRVGGIGAGTLTLTGSGIGEAKRKVVRSDTALVRASFTRNGRSHLRSGRSFRTRLTIKFKPTKGKAVTIRKTVRIAPAKR